MNIEKVYSVPELDKTFKTLESLNNYVKNLKRLTQKIMDTLYENKGNVLCALHKKPEGCGKCPLNVLMNVCSGNPKNIIQPVNRTERIKVIKTINITESVEKKYCADILEKKL